MRVPGAAIFALLVLAGRAYASPMAPADFSFPRADRSSVRSTATAFFPAGPEIAPVRITKVTTSGNYAVVAFAQGKIEGSTYAGQLLLERFTFGWQTVDVATGSGFETASLLEHGISEHQAAVLLGGFVASQDHRGGERLCAADSGPSADVTAVRALMRDRTHEAVGNVDVVSGYAIAGWVGNGGGADAFAQGKDGTWRRIGGGGGMIDAGYLVEKGVPKATAERLIKIHSGCG